VCQNNMPYIQLQSPNAFQDIPCAVTRVNDDTFMGNFRAYDVAVGGVRPDGQCIKHHNGYFNIGLSLQQGEIMSSSGCFSFDITGQSW